MLRPRGNDGVDAYDTSFGCDRYCDEPPGANRGGGDAEAPGGASPRASVSYFFATLAFDLASFVLAVYALATQHSDDIVQACGHGPWMLLLARVICGVCFNSIVYLTASESFYRLKGPLLLTGTAVIASGFLSLFIGLEGVFGAQALWSGGCVGALTAASSRAALLPISIYVYMAHDILQLLLLVVRSFEAGRSIHVATAADGSAQHSY